MDLLCFPLLREAKNADGISPRTWPWQAAMVFQSCRSVPLADNSNYAGPLNCSELLVVACSVTQVLFSYGLPTSSAFLHLPSFAMCNDHWLLKFILPTTILRYFVTPNSLLKQVLQISRQLTAFLFYLKYVESLWGTVARVGIFLTYFSDCDL